MAVFASGLGAPETPRFHPQGGWLCVEMAGRPGVTLVAEDGASRQIAPAGCPNGLAIDANGVAWVADTVPPALLRVSMDGNVETVMTAGDAGDFLLPNDLCFSPSGLLYMTDSGMTMGDWVVDGAPRPDWQTAPFDGRVWEIDLETRTAKAIDRGIRFTNGIAFGLDGDLYVNEMITGEVFRYAVADGRVTGTRTRFANVLAPDWQGGFRGPDGMGFSTDGRLWCAVYGEGNVAVVSPDGDVASRLKTEGSAPTNVAFGRDGEKRLYVTEHQLGRIEVFDVDAQGLELHCGRTR
ncbi:MULTISPECIES: SMP-30/gluconolactonase/LRE family protein [unclassified Roseitalea]|uniref:SMP-30/gluconolactonase/LRE family protein n=1 Tax=unclassified Roseitalea TaxID=2639107 RepID=UPI00273E237F|nr:MULTISPECIES: SMP-30/gluconolactonase/LRE family protein [unclassified Roseitalea]